VKALYKCSPFTICGVVSVFLILLFLIEMVNECAKSSKQYCSIVCLFSRFYCIEHNQVAMLSVIKVNDCASNFYMMGNTGHLD